MTTDYGFAAVRVDPADSGTGWALDANGQIQRATTVNDKVARLLAPLFGPVWSEKHRGNAARPKTSFDAIAVLVADRLRLVLQPMVDSGEISNLDVQAKPRGDGKFVDAAIGGYDRQRRVFKLSQFVRIG